MSSSIVIVGICDKGWNSLTLETQNIINSCDFVFGGQRHINMLPASTKAKQFLWESPISDSIVKIKSLSGVIVVLASGNPMWHGIGKIIFKNFPHEHISVIPAPSSFSLVCSKLGWSIEDTHTISLHNKSSDSIISHLSRNKKIIALTKNHSTLRQVAKILVSLSLPNVMITVLEHLSGKDESITSLSSQEWLDSSLKISDLYCIALEVPSSWRGSLPIFGLQDHNFIHDNTITKSHMRAITLASLSPHRGEVLWDIGAGAGSVAIEWCRLGGYAFAIEKQTKRFQQLSQNIKKFGLDNISAIHGKAPDSCKNIPHPNSIFIGGGISKDKNLFDFCYDSLISGGRLVANVVTLEGEKTLLDIQQRYGGELSRFNFSHAEQIGSLQGWRPSMPITQYCIEKP